jgi:4-aminobutyrate aminotransferase/(S)-3-amino-2-methylpropionate transaminase
MRRLRNFCTRNGSALIADEVQCGFGRTGTLFAMEQMGVEPDILVSAKSIAAGLPLSATTGRAELMDKAHIGGIGGTYGGNPLACVAAIEVLKMFEQGDLLQRARSIGQTICERGSAWKQEIELIGDVRSMGAMVALEMVKDRDTREPAPDEVLAVVKHCAERGLLTMRAGLYANCLRLLMPLTITDDQLQEGLEVLEDGLRAVNG